MSSSRSSNSGEDDNACRESNEAVVAVDTIVKFPRYANDYLTVSDSDEDYAVAGSVIDEDSSAYNIEQYAEKVLGFSAQYGIDLSISYAATNVIGRPTKYPEYGDSPQTFAMRTYGNWWHKSPSRISEIAPQNIPKVPAEDFIIVSFENYVIPEKIAIFETFNPGAVIRIWAYTIIRNWICLWEDNDFFTRPAHIANRARRFEPPLKRIRLPINTIKLEFNHHRLHYYTEIDAILLSGKKFNPEMLFDSREQEKKGSILSKLQNMKFRPICNESFESCLHHFLIYDLDKFLPALNNVQNTDLTNTKDSEIATIEPPPPRADFNDLPFDIVLQIFGYLDLVSLFRVGGVSRFLYDVSTHPSLYRELNLKPYWHIVSTELLAILAKRATNLKKLDMSWCGSHNRQTVSPTEFKKFIQQRGDSLTHMRLNTTRFLSNTCIDTIGIVCDNLKELSLRNCWVGGPVLMNFSCLGNLKNLERLDLHQTIIETSLLLTMLENNTKLKHLNLAFCNMTTNMDDVAFYISQYNKQLVSLDFWKAHYLSPVGLMALSACQNLEEVDFGWCLREDTLGDSLKIFLTNCPKIKKLFLAAVRGLSDRDLEDIADLCPNLEQLDLMGVLGISKEKYYELLQKCKKLQLMDLSFCDNITDYEVSLWSRIFNVDIKFCHQSNDFL